MSHDGFIAHCLELLAPLGQARSRRMFGGHGLYIDDLFVAIVVADRLYLKARAETAAPFAAAGGQPFTYPRSGKTATLGYWTVPAEALDSPEAMRPWARLAMQAAVQARSAPRSKPGRSSRPR